METCVFSKQIACSIIQNLNHFPLQTLQNLLSHWVGRVGLPEKQGLNIKYIEKLHAWQLEWTWIAPSPPRDPSASLECLQGLALHLPRSSKRSQCLFDTYCLLEKYFLCLPKLTLPLENNSFKLALRGLSVAFPLKIVNHRKWVSIPQALAKSGSWVGSMVLNSERISGWNFTHSGQSSPGLLARAFRHCFLVYLRHKNDEL